MVTPLHALTVVRELSVQKTPKHGEPSHGRRAQELPERVWAHVCFWTIYKIIPALDSEFGGKLCFWDAPGDQSRSFSYIHARAVNLVDTSDSVSHCAHI